MILQDLRFALRTAARRPGASIMLVVTLALGIGATTSIFSVVDAVLLRPAPFADAERLAELLTLHKAAGLVSQELSPDVAQFWEKQSHLFDRVERYYFESVHLTGADAPRRVRGARVTPGLLSLLGVRPLRGRLFTNDEATAGEPVALVGEELWRSTLGGSPDVVGRSVQLDGRSVTVIGVLPGWFKFPAGTQLLLPWTAEPRLSDGGEDSFSAVVHLAPSVDATLAQAEVDGIAERMNAGNPREGAAGWNVRLRLLGYSTARTDTKAAVWTLAGAVACVMLIACANAANLLMVQATKRRRELAIRTALGARRSRLLTQLLTESIAISAIAGALGVLVAWWSLRAIIALMPPEMTLVTYSTIGLDRRVLTFAVLISLCTGLAFGLGPAIRFSRQRERLAGTQAALTAPRSRRDVRHALVVAEFALSMLLVVGAGLLINSFARLTRVDLGVDAEHLLTVEPILPPGRYPDQPRRRALVERFVQRLHALPDVNAITVSGSAPPRTTVMIGTALEAEGQPPLDGGRELIPVTFADTNFFRTVGVRILRGRAFTSRDVAAETRPVIIDPDLAERLWAGQNPVGQRFRTGPRSAWNTVVGVASDVKVTGPDDRNALLAYYVPTSLDFIGSPSIIVRTGGDPGRIIPAVRQIVRDLDPDIPLERVAAWEQMFADTIMRPRFILTLMSVLAGVSLLLAAIGVYGVMAYTVSMRTQEIGVRLALGARSGEIQRRVLGDAFVLVGCGSALGLAASIGLSRLLEGMLFGIQPGDPMTIGAVTVAMGLVAGAAAFLPARRASRVSPMRALRSD